MENCYEKTDFVLLVGNANTGKTSFINRATKSSLHIGNWHGVTVGATARKVVMEGKVKHLVDLPGTYSLSPFSLEEKVTSDYVALTDCPIINICEQNNLKRNLLLTLQLLEFTNASLLINRFGKTKQVATCFDIDKLASSLGTKVCVVDFFSKKEIADFFSTYAPPTLNTTKKLPYLKEFPIEEIKNIIASNNLLNEELIKNTYKLIGTTNFNCIKKNEKNAKKHEKNAKKHEIFNEKRQISEIKNENAVKTSIIDNDFSISQNIDKILTFVAIRALESDFTYLKNAKECSALNTVLDKEDYVKTLYKARYDYIDKLLKECNYTFKNEYSCKCENQNNSECDSINKTLHKNQSLDKTKSNLLHPNIDELKNQKLGFSSQKLDKILLNKFLAIPIFILIMLLIFYLTFSSIGAYISGVFEFLIVEVIGAPLLFLIEYKIGKGVIYSLVADGIIGGGGSVFSFLPQVVLLFLFLTILEESGYMSRLAYLLEGVFKKVGLSGKSVFTFLMGFGCTATAIMTAQNLNNKNEKVKTVLCTPFMACSAKLPVFAVIGGAFFANGNVIVIFLMYLFSALLGVLIANLLDKTRLKNSDKSFILEFPPYRLPKFKTLIKSVSSNTKQFLTRIGGYILFFSILIWLLQSFTLSFEFIAEPTTATQPPTLTPSNPTFENDLNSLQNTEQVQGKVSILQSFAQLIAPIFAPLGFGEWGAVSALLAGLVAKELIVSSIGIINRVSANGELVGESLLLQTNPICFTPASSLSFLTFCLLYTPCIATISVMRAETGAKWTIFSVLMQLIVAYVGAYFVFKVASIIQVYGTGAGLLKLGGIVVVCFAVIKCINYLAYPKPCKNCKYNQK